MDKYEPSATEKKAISEILFDRFGTERNLPADFIDWAQEIESWMPLDTPALLCAEIRRLQIYNQSLKDECAKLREANEVMKEMLEFIPLTHEGFSEADNPCPYTHMNNLDELVQEALAKVEEITRS